MLRHRPASLLKLIFGPLWALCVFAQVRLASLMFSSAELQAALDAGRAPELALEEHELAPLVALLTVVRGLEDAFLASEPARMALFVKSGLGVIVPREAAARGKGVEARTPESEPAAAAPPSSDPADARASGRTEPEAPRVLKLQAEGHEVTVPVTWPPELLQQLEPSAAAPPDSSARARPARSKAAKKKAGREGHVRMTWAPKTPKRSTARPKSEQQKAPALPGADERSASRQKIEQWRAAEKERAAASALAAALGPIAEPPSRVRSPAVTSATPSARLRRHGPYSNVHEIAYFGGKALTKAMRTRILFNHPGASINFFGCAADRGQGERSRLKDAIKKGSYDLVIVEIRFVGHTESGNLKELCESSGVRFQVRKQLLVAAAGPPEVEV